MLPSTHLCSRPVDSGSADVDGQELELPIKDRILYDVFFHEPAWPSITIAPPPSSSALPTATGGVAASPTLDVDDERYYEVSEADYLTQRLNSYAQSLTTREQLRRRFFCWQRRKPRDTQPPPPPHDINKLQQPNDGDQGAQTASVREELDDDDAAAQAGIHWPILLSGSTHMLALLTESSIILRSALTQYAFIDLATAPIPPYVHSRSPYAASQPSSHLFSSSLHPFSYLHNRPAAWYKDDMVAVAVKDDTVSVYDVEPVSVDKDNMPRSSIRHTFSFSLSAPSSPLEPSPAASLSLVARVAGGRRKQYPTIAGMVWRDAVCHRNVRGVCPHLIVLTYDGQLHHLHIPSQLPTTSSAVSSSPSRLAWDARVPPHAPPTASHSRASSIVLPGTGAGLQTFASPSRREGGHSRAVTSVVGAVDTPATAARKEEGKRGEVQTWSGLKQQHGTRQSDEDEQSEDDESVTRAKNSGGLKRRRKQPAVSVPSTTADTSAEDTQTPIPLAFTSIGFSAATQLLVVSSVTLTSDRCPQLSIWSMKDQSSQTFIHRYTTTLVQTVHREERRQRRSQFAHTVQRVWKRVKVNVGLETDDDSTEAKTGADGGTGGYESTLSDITMFLTWSPSGRHLMLLDVLGNMNIWGVDA